MTLKGQNITLAEINKISRAHHKNFNEDGLILSDIWLWTLLESRSADLPQTPVTGLCSTWSVCPFGKSWIRHCWRMHQNKHFETQKLKIYGRPLPNGERYTLSSYCIHLVPLFVHLALDLTRPGPQILDPTLYAEFRNGDSVTALARHHFHSTTSLPIPLCPSRAMQSEGEHLSSANGLVWVMLVN